MTTKQARSPGPHDQRPEPIPRPDSAPDTEPTSKRDDDVAVPVPDNTTALDVAVGLLFQAQDQVRRAGESIDTVGRRAATRLDHARERGLREMENYRRRADAMVRQAASAALQSRAMDDIVTEVTTRFATPIVEAQLPVVIERLGERPEVLRPIVDQTVERFASRFLMPRPESPNANRPRAADPP